MNILPLGQQMLLTGKQLRQQRALDKHFWPGQGQKVFNNHKLIANRQAAIPPFSPQKGGPPTYLHLPQRQHPGTCM